MAKSAYENAKKQISEAISLMDWDNKWFNEIMNNPERILEISIPVKMDNGEIKVFKAYRSQHNNARGPYKWGIRFHQDVNKDEVMALSIWMSIKTSVLDLPLWWGKWGIIVNPKELSIWEIERLSRGYVRAIFKYIGPGQDVPAPDVNTNPQIMAFMADEYAKIVWNSNLWSFTGKPLTFWGSKWRWKATAQGWVYSLETFLELEKDSIQGKKVAIQWAWNAGLTMAKLLLEKWAKIIAISDSRWWVYDENWLDIDKIEELKQNRKSVWEYSAKAISNEEILEIDADILVPAALENQITAENADKIKAKIIVELANWPTTPEADEILEEKNITVLPDILANAGWVTVSYYEQVQNDANFYWEEDEIEEKLKKSMKKSTKEVYETSKKIKSSLRKSAFVLALTKIKNAMIDKSAI